VARNTGADYYDVLVRATLVCKDKNESRLITLRSDENSSVADFALKRVVERPTNSSMVTSRLEDDTCSR
jgi:hypothetical protein